MVEAIYILCAATSVACAVMLLRAYTRSGARFLLWSGLCFVFLGLNNLILFFDLVVFDDIELRLARHGTALAGLMLLVWGLIWDAE